MCRILLSFAAVALMFGCDNIEPAKPGKGVVPWLPPAPSDVSDGSSGPVTAPPGGSETPTFLDGGAPDASADSQEDDSSGSGAPECGFENFGKCVSYCVKNAPGPLSNSVCPEVCRDLGC